jgi:hypothetical protein
MVVTIAISGALIAPCLSALVRSTAVSRLLSIISFFSPLSYLRIRKCFMHICILHVCKFSTFAVCYRRGSDHPLSAHISDFGDPETQGTILGISQAFTAFARAAGPMAAAALYSQVAFPPLPSPPLLPV